MIPKKIFDKLSSNPKSIFIVDGIGAAISAIMLGLVLVHYNVYFGIPIHVLYILASIPIIFVIYDLICFFNEDMGLSKSIRTIGILNVLYSVVSLSMSLYHFDSLTMLGWVYILGEIVIILIIASVEFRLSREINK